MIKDEVSDLLLGFGIKNSDTVLMHTSLKAIGNIEEGLDAFIDGFIEYLSDGTYIIPTHTWANVNEDNPVFDVRTTQPCIGLLPTVAVKRADGVRSLHPTHSVVAFGKRAKEYVRGEEKCTSPAPPFGAWARLIDENAKILLVGVGLNRNTFIHAVDEILDLPNKLVEPIPLTIIGYDGEEYHTNFRKHGTTGSENYGVFYKPLIYAGALSVGKLRNATVLCVDAKKCSEEIKRLYSVATYDLTKEEVEIPENYYKF